MRSAVDLNNGLSHAALFTYRATAGRRASRDPRLDAHVYSAPTAQAPPCRFLHPHGFGIYVRDIPFTKAVVRVALKRGCLCFPDDREQDLCDYHFEKATPRGGWRNVSIIRYWPRR